MSVLHLFYKLFHQQHRAGAGLLVCGKSRAQSRAHLVTRWLCGLLVAFIMLGGWPPAQMNSYAAPGVAPVAAPVAQSAGDPLVLAFYYTWFDEQTWSYDRLSDLPAEPYVSRDRAVMGRHIDQAKAAGIDAFLVAWYGPSGEFNQTEPNLVALLEEAAARQFKIGILFESDSPFLGNVGAVTGALQHALAVHANQPAFLRVDGRPVIFFWRPTIYGVDSWRAIRSQVDPGFSSIWIAEGVDIGYQAIFDGHHLYSNTWNPPNDLAYTNQKFANLVQQASQGYGTHKFWVSTVMAGYNDLRIRPGGGFATDREGGAYYERSWQAAIASQPDWVVINSFNEWPEGTYIEPSAAFGGHYLGLTAAWSAQFKSRGSQSVAPPVSAALAAEEPVAPPIPVPLPTPTPYPEPTTPNAYVQVTVLNLRAGPGTERYAVVGQVLGDQALPISGQNAAGDWWQVRVGEQVAWVSGAYVYAAGPLATVPIVAVPIMAEQGPIVAEQVLSVAEQERTAPEDGTIDGIPPAVATTPTVIVAVTPSAHVIATAMPTVAITTANDAATTTVRILIPTPTGLQSDIQSPATVQRNPSTN